MSPMDSSFKKIAVIGPHTAAEYGRAMGYVGGNEASLGTATAVRQASLWTVSAPEEHTVPTDHSMAAQCGPPDTPPTARIALPDTNRYYYFGLLLASCADVVWYTL